MSATDGDALQKTKLQQELLAPILSLEICQRGSPCSCSKCSHEQDGMNCKKGRWGMQEAMHRSQKL